MSLTIETNHNVVIFRADSADDAYIKSILDSKIKNIAFSSDHKTLVAVCNTKEEADLLYSAMSKLDFINSVGDK